MQINHKILQLFDKIVCIGRILIIVDKIIMDDYRQCHESQKSPHFCKS